jgi:hypothetical protein
MTRAARRHFPHLLISVGIAAIALSGCSGTQSSTAALDASLKAAGVAKEKVYPLAGRITVDGQPPQLGKTGDTLVVVLNDPKQPDVPAMAKQKAIANHDGEFNFTTYEKDDGVKEGKYVLTIALLHRRGKKGYLGPDELKNLYNDPDKNANSPEFAIDHKAPGKSDYAINLELAGKEAGIEGPHSLTSITDKGMK